MNSTLSHHSDATLITDYNSFPLNCQRELGFNTMWITKFVLRIPTVRNILKSFIRLFQRLFGRHKSLDSILCDNKVFFVIFWNFSFNCLSVVKYLLLTKLMILALFDMRNLNRFDILSISIFCKIALSISISISIFSKITISISISISIFLELPYRYRYRYRYFSELPYRYRYRYRYFSKVSIYRQSICHIDISNRANYDTLFLG